MFTFALTVHATLPVRSASQGVSFFYFLGFIFLFSAMFEKKPTTITQEIALLKQRGLQIESDVDAVHFLSHISYYRLGEYWHSMQSDQKKSHF